MRWLALLPRKLSKNCDGSEFPAVSCGFGSLELNFGVFHMEKCNASLSAKSAFSCSTTSIYPSSFEEKEINNHIKERVKRISRRSSLLPSGVPIQVPSAFGLELKASWRGEIESRQIGGCPHRRPTHSQLFFPWVGIFGLSVGACLHGRLSDG